VGSSLEVSAAEVSSLSSWVSSSVSFSASSNDENDDNATTFLKNAANVDYGGPKHDVSFHVPQPELQLLQSGDASKSLLTSLHDDSCLLAGRALCRQQQLF
jgi:hypothetical protein